MGEDRRLAAAGEGLLTRTLYLYDRFCKHSKVDPYETEHRILGPTSSGGLAEMIKECVWREDFRLYSPWATIAEPVLRIFTNDVLSPSTFERTVPNDQKLVRLLLDKLALRDASPPQLGPAAAEPGNEECPGNHLVVIGEWDTLYGRSMRCTFVNEVRKSASEYNCAAAEPCNVHFLSYFRGLDGKVPSSSQPSASQPDKKIQTGPEAAPPSESSTGTAQTDYLRRLERDLYHLQIKLRREGGSIRAIGVLGSDIYDKLLVLRALRPRFAGAVFFTTDLDSQLFDAKEYRHTRNMIVASPFGLALHEDLQAHILPFRDSYQTSMFWSTLLAAEQKKAELLCDMELPRAFEIARGGAFDLNPTVPDGIHPESGADRNWKAFSFFSRGIAIALCFGASLAAFQLFTKLSVGAVQLLPPRDQMVNACSSLVDRWSGLLPAARQPRIKRAPRWIKAAVVVLPGLTLLVAVFPSCWGLVKSIGAALWAPLGARLSEIFASLASEPMSLTGGISAWPTQALRFLTMALAVWMIARIWRKLKRKKAELAKQFALSEGSDAPWMRIWRNLKRRKKAEPPKQSAAMALAVCMIVRLWRKSKRKKAEPSKQSALSKGSDRVKLSVFNTICLRWPSTDEIPTVQRAWRVAGKLREPSFRVARISIAVILFVCFGVVLMLTFGFPFRPIRGHQARFLDWYFFLWPSVVVFLFLVFFVHDASRWCFKLIRTLAQDKVKWSGTGSNVTEYLQKLRLIASLTETVGGLFKFPFIILLLMIISRHSLFDDWDWPPGLLVIFALLLALILFGGWLVRYAAQSARDVALQALHLERDRIVRKADGDKSEERRVVDHAIDQITKLSTGGFAPLTEDPMLRALLIPTGGLGLWELMLLLVRGSPFAA